VIDLQGLAERGDVGDPVIEIPMIWTAFVAATVASLIEKEDLSDVGEPRKGRFHAAVVEPGTAVQANDYRSVLHVRSVWNEAHARDVEVQRCIANANAHVEILGVAQKGSGGRSSSRARSMAASAIARSWIASPVESKIVMSLLL
jgi:hypothetical protein